jgi:hypothetical protein
MVTVQPYSNAQVQTLAEEVGKLIYNTDTKLLMYCDSFGYRDIISFKTNLGAGINTFYPQTAFDVNSTSGACLRLIYNNNTGTATSYMDADVASNGGITFTSVGSSPSFTFSGGNILGTIGTAAQPNITSLGTLTTVDATTINVTTLNATTIGSSGVLNLSPTGSSVSLATNKNLILDGTGSISGVSSLTATNIYGTIMTGDQPNITSIGNLGTLSISNNASGGIVGSFTSTNSSNTGYTLTSTSATVNGNCLGLINNNTTANGVYFRVSTDGSLTIAPDSSIISLIGAVDSITTLSLSGIAISTNATSSTSSVLGALILAGGLAISNATNSTSATNGGSITTAGGAAIAQSLWVGTTFNVAGVSISTNATASTSSVLGGLRLAGGLAISNATDSVSATNGGTITTAGGASIAKALWVGTTLNVAGVILSTNTTAATSSVLGGLRLAGGLAISLATDATSSTNGGTITTAGGAAIALSLWVGTTLNVAGVTLSTNTTASTSSVLGALRSSGGIGISNTTDATSSTNGGTFTSAGGGAFAKALFVGTTLTATTLTGPLSTAAQPNVTSLGTLTGLDISGILNSTNTTISNTNSTGAITLYGGVGISNTTDAVSSTNGGTFTSAGGGAFAKALFVGTTLTATTLTGTLSTAAQPNVTSLGTLTSLALAGTISGVTTLTATTLAGTLSTAAQPNVTSVGTLTSLALAGAISGVTTLSMSGIETSTNATASTSNILGSKVFSGGISISNVTDAISSTNGGTFTSAGGGAFAKALFVGTTLTATTLTGTLSTAAQPNVTSVGTLTSLALAGALSGVTTINSSGIETSTNTTASTSNVLGSKLLSGGISISNTTDAVSSTNGGTFTSAGGGAFAKALFVGTTLTANTLAGTLSTSAQPNVTSVGTLTSLALSGAVSGVTTLGLSGAITLSSTADATSSTSGGTFTSSGGGAFAKSLYIGNDLTVLGDLNITGTTTTFNSTNVTISDNVIELNSGPTGVGFDSGLILMRYQNDNSAGTGDVVNDTAKITFTLVSATSTTITLPSGADASNDYYNGWWIKITSGSAINQVREIVSYVGSTRVATLDAAFAITPSADNISLYNKHHSLILWNESLKRFVLGYTATDNLSTTFNISDYANLAINNLTLDSNSTSTSNTTGSIISNGGIGISNTTDAISTTNGGTFTSAGGGAFAKALFVGTTLTATTLTGTLSTAAQPNITSVGTLTSLALAGALSGVTTLNMSGIETSTNTTASTSNVLGSKVFAGGISISNTTDSISTTNGGTFTSSGGGAFAKALFVGTTLTATTLTGTLSTAAQPNITSVGTLTSLELSGALSGVTTLNMSGIETSTNTTASTSNVLGSKLFAGGISISNATDAVSTTNGGTFTSAGGGAFAKALFVGTTLTATTLAGTLSTAAQPNITSVGTLTSLALAGALSGVTTLNMSGIETSTNATASTSNVLGSKVFAGGISISNVTDAVSTTNGGTFTSAGGGAFAKALFVGTTLTATTLTGTLSTAAQTAITSVGTLTSLAITAPLEEIYGGTGKAAYVKGDILVANTTTTLAKVPVPATNGTMLVTDSTSATGVAWSSNILFNYTSFSNPVFISSTSYTFPSFAGRNAADTDNIIIPSTTVNLTVDGLNGITISSNLSGTIYPNPTTTTITGTSTTFTTDFLVGGIITTGNSTRRIASIASDTSLTVDTAFNALNLWSLVGAATLSTAQFRFGSASLAAATAPSYGNLALGLSSGLNATADAWTIEMFIRLTANNAALAVCTSAIGFSFALAYTNTGTRLTISLGQGTTFNIANATAVTVVLAATTWYHVAVVFTGTAYTVYVNGALGATITSSLKITSTTFNNLRFGGNTVTTYNGFIDEVRISNIARYTGAFSAPSAAFTSDANTAVLNHFNGANIVVSDDMVNNIQLNYIRGGVYYANSMLYAYALGHPTTPGYVLSTRKTLATLVDVPAGYSTTNCRQVPFYIPVVTGNVPSTVFFSSGSNFNIFPSITVVTGATNIVTTTYQLANFLPVNCNMVNLLLTQAHVTTTAAGITIGANSTYYQTVLSTTIASTIQLTINVLLLPALSIEAFLSANAAGSSYTIQIIGFSVYNNI